MARLVAAQCPRCGAHVRIDPDREYVTCGYCGTSSFVQTRTRRLTEELRQQQAAVIDVSTAFGNAAMLAVFLSIAVAGLAVALFVVVKIATPRATPASKAAEIEIPLDRDRPRAGPTVASKPAPTMNWPPPERLDEASPASKSGAKQASSPTKPSIGGARVRDGALTVSGRLGADAIRRVVRAQHARFRMCFEQALARNGSLRGSIRPRFVIGRDGQVSNVSLAASEIPDHAMQSCVASALMGLTFPAPEGGIVTVVYPLLFDSETKAR